MNQYCRYCAGLVTGNGIYCTYLNKEKTEASTKVVNYCKHFEFCEMDAYDMEHTYKPKIQKPRGSPDEQIEGQMSIFDMEEVKNGH